MMQQEGAAAEGLSFAQVTAVWVGSFLDELVRWGVRDVVVSPGSRSTALAMGAYELSRLRPGELNLYIDVDERGAAFFALGRAKASGRPAALVCTSGTALANYYPAVIEAQTSRVPLVVLSADRPPRLQGLGAPQTADQLKAYGDHVRAFRAMPLAAAGERDVAFVRQAAREACLAALGGRGDFAPQAGAALVEAQIASRACARAAGPVHVNFPFEEPLAPDFSGIDAFGRGRSPLAADADAASAMPAMPTRAILDDGGALSDLLRTRCTLVLAGEGTASTTAEARAVMAWARDLGLPVLADPLSGLRACDEPLLIDNYDNVFAHDDCPLPDLVIRFGRWPVSKRAASRLSKARAQRGLAQVVVDVAETRDFNAATDVFVPMTPLDFVRSMDRSCRPDSGQLAFAQAWIERNDEARERILAVSSAENADELEGAYVRRMLELAPAQSCVFAANSMAVRALDTFSVKGGKTLCILGNRGQSGIDGTTSTALGAAQSFAQTTFLAGDFTLLHDMSALAMQHELLCCHGGAAHAIAIGLLNNNGGAIFDTLPQATDEPSFERLFLAPQDVDFEHAARAFRIPYQRVDSVLAFDMAYRQHLGVPGISIVEVRLPLRGVKERYGAYQR